MWVVQKVIHMTNWKLAVLGIVGLTACTIRPDAYSIDGKDVEAVFIHTADIHSRLLPYNMDVLLTDEQLGLLQKNAPFGGMAKLAAVVKQERRDNLRMAYLDSGDVFQGAPIFNSFGGEPEFKAMSQMQVTAFAIGNHEFDNGTDHLVDMAGKYAAFPMLASNYSMGDPDLASNIPTGRLANPYTIINMKGLRVAVIGLGYVGGSPYHGGGSKGVVPLRIKEVLQGYVDYLRPQVDLVTVVSHASYHEDIEYIPRTEGIDIVFGGHLHIVLNPPKIVQDCDVERLERERDRYKCDTPEKLEAAQKSCETNERCADKSGGEKTQCEKQCREDAVSACQREAQVKKFDDRLRELDEDIRFLKDRGCHPRNVLLVHSGAFLKFIGKLEVTLRQCNRITPTTVCVSRDPDGNCVREVPRRCTGGASGTDDWEVVASKYKLVPVDRNLPEDPQMLQLLEPYTLELARQQQLTKVIGYARGTLKRFSTGSGDSMLGNLVTEAMQQRSQVWADFAVTNSLGIRSDLIHGPVDEEQMVNVFPFDNSITTMVLSGYEVQEMFDFIAQRSQSRGCQPQSQVAGATVTLNCRGCAGNGGNACARAAYDGEACGQRVTIGGTGRPCKEDKDCATLNGKPSDEICTGQFYPDQGKYPGHKRCFKPIACAGSYMLAANDYIAHGGSGFVVLGRNTTQKNLKIPLRRAAIDFITQMRACSLIPQTIDDKIAGRPPKSVLDAQDTTVLKEVEEAALTGDPAAIKRADAEYAALRKRLEDRAKTAKGLELSGLLNYLGCSSETLLDNNTCDGLACAQVQECESYGAKNMAQCKALGRIRAALRCVTIPCVEANEDGRIQRIFRTSGSPDQFYDPY